MKLKFGNYCIRNFEDNDIHSLVKYANNINVAKNLRDAFPNPYKLEHAIQWIKIVKEGNRSTHFAVANEEELIGGIGLILQEDVHRLNAEIGYWLGEPFWGQGIMTEAVKIFTNFVFKEFNVIRLYARIYESNKSSARVLEKAEYKLEAVFDKSIFKNGIIQNEYIYSILNQNRI
ncbi:MAG: GNAT family N-acetyltransferase [Ignavibacteriales bacterium]|nr:GNAT family N-acetyltransferase [Ignavibacteriales bacterium]